MSKNVGMLNISTLHTQTHATQNSVSVILLLYNSFIIKKLLIYLPITYICSVTRSHRWHGNPQSAWHLLVVSV